MDLLRASIFSSTPLTDVVLQKGNPGSAIPGVEPGALSHKLKGMPAGFGGGQCVLRVIVQKSTNRLLFVESWEHFVDFLFSLFAIPLGGIEHFLGGVTPFFKNINNMMRSVEAIDNKYFECDRIKTKLTQLHNLPRGYCSDRQIFPLHADTNENELYYSFQDSLKGGVGYLSHSWVPGSSKHTVCYDDYPKPEKSYVRRAVMFKISDDLTVGPMSALDGMDVPFSDVGEQEVTIQAEKALRILMASHTSTLVLSTVLGPMLMKKPTQEICVINFD